MTMTYRQTKWLTLLVIAVAGASLAASRKPQDLLTNGTFERWDEETGEPLGWHTRITSIVPIPEYRDPENKKGRTGVYHFKCGCGYMWGTVRPWTNLVCPQCKQMNHGLEDSASNYDLNYESVVATDGKSGKGAGLKMSAPVGNNQGARIISKLVKAERGAGYKLSFDAKTQGPNLKVFVEGFQLQPKDKKAREWVKTLEPESNPQKFTARLKRVYRHTVHARAGGDWQHFSSTHAAPERHACDYMFVTLYAYLPGEASYDNVVLRKLTAKELKAHYREHGRPKSRRLR